MIIEKDLMELTNNFTEDPIALISWTEFEANSATKLLKDHYSKVDVKKFKDRTKNKIGWYIKCSSVKPLREAFDDEDIDLSEFDDLDTNDPMDMDDYNLDSIDDSDEVADANQLTILKKRAADLATKWNDTFKQISDLARRLDLIVSHDDELNITINKADGSKAKINKDLDRIKQELSTETDDVDDSFGPSEYDGRANKLGPDVEIPREESLYSEHNNTVINEQKESAFNLNNNDDPEALYLDPNDVDDDF